MTIDNQYDAEEVSPVPLNSVEWAAMHQYARQIEEFKSKDLTDQEVLVMKWMQKKVEEYKARS